MAFLPSRRTRTIFDVVIRVHQNIQHRDIEAGRNLGNWVLRCLDRLKPSAEIRPPSPGRHPSRPLPDRASSYNGQPAAARQKPCGNLADKVSKGRLLFARWNSMAKSSSSPPAVAVMMAHPAKSLGTNGQLRQLCGHASGHRPRYGGVFRSDIAFLMQRN